MMRTLTLLCALLGVAQVRGYTVAANIGGSSYYGGQGVYCDIVKQAQYPFGSSKAPYNREANCSANACDANHWPTVSSYGIWMWQMESDEDAGMYTIKANGNAVVSSWMFGPAIDVKYDATTNVWTGAINASTGTAGHILDLRIENASAGGFVNVSVRNPRCGDKDMLHPNYVSLLKKFSGPLRSMSAVGATDSGQTDWDTRHQMDAPTWTVNPALPCVPIDGGKQVQCDNNVPWEVIIETANAAGRDLWVNVPPNATDEYMVQLAILLNSTLNPDLNIYVEYANEVWNWIFPVAHWNLAMAKIEVAAGDAAGLNYDNCGNPGYWAWRRVAWKLMGALNIMSATFDYNPDRLRGIYASQLGSGKGLGNFLGGPAAEALGYVSNVYGTPGDFFYALAGAPYFGLGDATSWANLTEQMVLDISQTVIDGYTPNAGNNFTQSDVVGFAALARWNGLRLVGYEGGPDYSGTLVDPGANRSIAQRNIDAKMDARLSTQMRGLIKSYLDGLQSAGMDWLEFFGAFIGTFNTTITYSVIQDVNDDLDSYTMLSGISDAVAAPTPSVTAGWPVTGSDAMWDLPAMQLAIVGGATGPCSDCGGTPCMRCLPSAPSADDSYTPLHHGTLWAVNTGSDGPSVMNVQLNMTTSQPTTLTWFVNGFKWGTVTANTTQPNVPVLGPAAEIRFDERFAVVGVMYSNTTAADKLEFAVYNVLWTS